LLAMLGVLPSWLPINVHLLGNFLKRRNLAFGIETRLHPLLGHSAAFQRAFTRLVERHNIRTARSSAARRMDQPLSKGHCHPRDAQRQDSPPASLTAFQIGPLKIPHSIPLKV